MQFDTLKFENHGGIGVITLNRPEARNAMSPQMRVEFAELLRNLRPDDSVKAVIIIGEGRAFCSGGDLRSMSESRRTANQSRRRIHDIHVWLPELVNLEKPVIAAVDGPAYGGGFSLALSADFVLASTRARFCSVFQRIGLVPDMGLLWLLPRLLGLSRAKEIIFSGRVIGAEEGKSLGFVHSIHESDDLKNAALEFAGRFLHASTLSLGLSKNILNQSLHLDQRAIAEMESYAQGLCMDSDYHNECVAKFLRGEELPYRWEMFEAAAVAAGETSQGES